MLAPRCLRQPGRIGAPCSRTPVTARTVRCRSSVETFTASLLAAEQEGDVMRTMEVVTEARVLKLDLPADAMEAGIRTFAAGGQWKRAVDMLEAMAAGGQHAQQGTALAVFKALADGQQADKALELLESMEQSGRLVSSPVRNLVVRTCATGGRLDRALELLEAMAESAMKSTVSDSDSEEEIGRPIEGSTFSAVAAECLKQGLSSKAEEVLDWRDYL